MDSIYTRLRAALPKATFSPPATAGQITEVEKSLNAEFPAWLRELYLNCDGIRGKFDDYLLPLELPDYGMRDWNLFLRQLWNDNLAEGKRLRPSMDWDRWDVHKLLIIGKLNTLEWAVLPEGGTEIMLHDVRNVEWQVIAKDLVEACLAEEAEQNEAHEEVYRGREFYRDTVYEPKPAHRDIDRIVDGTNRYAERAISQRPGEMGELFITFDEARIVSRDGNCPFVMRLKVWSLPEELSCIAWTVEDAVSRLNPMQRLVGKRYLPNGELEKLNEPLIQQIWRSDSPRQDPELERMADILCARDDARRIEENRLGG